MKTAPIWKKSMISGFGLFEMRSNIQDISDEFWDRQEEFTAMEDFYTELTYITSRAEDLLQEMHSHNYDEDEFNLAAVSVLGRRYKVLGYDVVEEDYYAMFDNAEEWATDEAARKFKTRTKDEMLRTWSKLLTVIITYLDVKSAWDGIMYAIELINNEGTKLEKVMNAVERAYKNLWGDRASEKDFALAVSKIPQRMWIE